ncbi:MAG: hypothetical protein MAGBODY4_01749 [Candidatus Marinimicrobia bacterium]|nr:hypothetical protein [Candidatus Neomarinimicrobiota bacterium]
MKQAATLFLIALSFILMGCESNKERTYQTTGTVEAYQVDVRSPVSGEVLFSAVKEGKRVTAGSRLALIDTTNFHLQKVQIHKQLEGIELRFASINNQEKQLNTRLRFLQKQYERFSHLAENEGVARSKVDEIETERDVVLAQLDELPVQRRQTRNKKDQLTSQLDLLEYRISQLTISAPASGVMLERFINTGEQIQAGHLLTSIGVTDTVWVMMYLPEPMLSRIQTGSEITVKPDGVHNTLTGKVAWISSEAEFTPKTVYTEDTRTSLTYGVRVRIPNNEGILKIGMPVVLELSK